MKPSQIKNTPKLQIGAPCIRTNKENGEKNDGKRKEKKEKEEKNSFPSVPNIEKEGVITARGSASCCSGKGWAWVDYPILSQSITYNTSS